MPPLSPPSRRPPPPPVNLYKLRRRAHARTALISVVAAPVDGPAQRADARARVRRGTYGRPRRAHGGDNADSDDDVRADNAHLLACELARARFHVQIVRQPKSVERNNVNRRSIEFQLKTKRSQSGCRVGGGEKKPCWGLFIPFLNCLLMVAVNGRN